MLDFLKRLFGRAVNIAALSALLANMLASEAKAVSPATVEEWRTLKVESELAAPQATPEQIDRIKKKGTEIAHKMHDDAINELKAGDFDGWRKSISFAIQVANLSGNPDVALQIEQLSKENEKSILKAKVYDAVYKLTKLNFAIVNHIDSAYSTKQPREMSYDVNGDKIVILAEKDILQIFQSIPASNMAFELDQARQLAFRIAFDNLSKLPMEIQAKIARII